MRASPAICKPLHANGTAQAWWFWIIVKIMWASLTSKNLQALDDIREEDPAEGTPSNKNETGKKTREVPSKVGPCIADHAGGSAC